MAESPLESGRLQAICYALGDTAAGLTGTEIGALLAECGIDDPGPITKRERLFQALSARQRRDRTSNNVFAFVGAALNPARFIHQPDRYAVIREATNRALSLSGYFIQEDGAIRRASPSKTIDEAIEAASGLSAQLHLRRIHPSVLRFCRTELLQEDYFHAVLEATKGLADELRARSGSSEDGAKLVDFGLAGDRKHLPRLAGNRLETDTDWSEHLGIYWLFKGAFSLLRNPPAHVPRLKREVEELEALDALTLLSMLHRRLDELVPTGAVATSK